MLITQHWSSRCVASGIVSDQLLFGSVAFLGACSWLESDIGSFDSPSSVSAESPASWTWVSFADSTANKYPRRTRVGASSKSSGSRGRRPVYVPHHGGVYRVVPTVHIVGGGTGWVAVTNNARQPACVFTNTRIDLPSQQTLCACTWSCPTPPALSVHSVYPLTRVCSLLLPRPCWDPWLERLVTWFRNTYVAGNLNTDQTSIGLH